MPLRNSILNGGRRPSAWQLLLLARRYEICYSPEIWHLKLRSLNLANLLRQGRRLLHISSRLLHQQEQSAAEGGDDFRLCLIASWGNEWLSTTHQSLDTEQDFNSTYGRLITEMVGTFRNASRKLAFECQTPVKLARQRFANSCRMNGGPQKDSSKS